MGSAQFTYQPTTLLLIYDIVIVYYGAKVTAMNRVLTFTVFLLAAFIAPSSAQTASTGSTAPAAASEAGGGTAVDPLTIARRVAEMQTVAERADHEATRLTDGLLAQRPNRRIARGWLYSMIGELLSRALGVAQAAYNERIQAGQLVTARFLSDRIAHLERLRSFFSSEERRATLDNLAAEQNYRAREARVRAAVENLGREAAEARQALETLRPALEEARRWRGADDALEHFERTIETGPRRPVQLALPATAKKIGGNK
jgi:hypothetical protein